MSQLVFSIFWNLEVGSNAREGVDWLERSRASRQRGQASPFHVLYVGYQQEWLRLKVDRPTWIKSGPSHFK